VRTVLGRNVPKAAETPQTFSDDQVTALAVGLKMSDAELVRLAETMRSLARIFIREAATRPADADVARDIKRLHAAANGHRYTTAANLVSNVPKPTRVHLNKRAKRTGLTIPRPSAFLDLSRREAACERLRRLLTVGAHREQGKLVPHLYLPKRELEREERVQQLVWLALEDASKRGDTVDVGALRRKATAYVRAEMVKDAKRRGVALELRSPKRKAERNFIRSLQMAFRNIAGRDPPVTARKYEQPATRTEDYSPFIKFAQECLHRLGAGNASAAELINSPGQRGAAVTRKR
jgi:hypothetical protein